MPQEPKSSSNDTWSYIKQIGTRLGEQRSMMRRMDENFGDNTMNL